MNDSAYKLDLPSEYNVSDTFNVSNLSLYDVGHDLRANPFQMRGMMEVHPRARKMKKKSKCRVDIIQGVELRRSKKNPIRLFKTY